jgi:hypothetical protein
MRLGMCRPHHGEIAFSLLFLGLLALAAPLFALEAAAAASTSACFGSST